MSSTSVWRAPGMPALVGMTALGFSGYCALLPVAPLWAVHGGAGAGGAGLVNGVFMLFTVLTQLFVPASLRRFGWAPVFVTGMVLLGAPALLYLASDDLTAILLLSAVRGMGFGVLTVTGSAAVAELVEPARRGAAIGAYGLAVALPQVFLLPVGPWVAENLGFWVVFAVSACPLLGSVPAVVLARTLRDLPQEGAEHVGEGLAHGRWATYLRLLRPMVLLLGVTLAGGALITFTPQMSSSPAATTAALVLLTGAAALSRWRFGSLADRYGAQSFLWPLVVLLVVGMALTAWAVRDSEATVVVGLLAGLAVVGVSYGGLQNLTLVVSFGTVPRRDYDVASAVWNIGFDAGTGLGSVLVGAIAAGTSFPVALLAAGGFSLATLPLALLRPRPGRGPRERG